MKLLVANHTSEIVGGAEQYLAKVVPALIQTGVTVRFLSEGETPFPGGVQTWRSTEREQRSEIEAWKPDVVFVHGLSDVSIEKWLLERYPAVLFAHNYYGTCISGEKRHRFPNNVTCERRFGPACLAMYLPRGCGPLGLGAFAVEYPRQVQRNRLLARYKEVIVASHHMGNELTRHGARSVTVAPLFVDAPPEALRTRSEKTFVFVGRMTEPKGGHVAIAACRWLAMRLGVDVELDMVGSGPEQPRWESEARRLGVRARFYGWLDPARRDEIVSSACGLILSSLWPEPFGLVGLEAARLGIPSVGFDVGGVREWLSDGENGALCVLGGDLPASIGNGLARVRADRCSDDAWSRAAIRTARRFGPARHMAILLQVFERAVGSRR
jgi:glycosyltransferase involved in cell wall biosynthesis